jgi:hypothetical protein
VGAIEDSDICGLCSGHHALSRRRFGGILRPCLALGSAGDRLLHPRNEIRNLRASPSDPDLFVLRLQIQTEESINRLMQNNLCLLATDIKTENAASIAEIACAELRERAAAKKKVVPGGPKKP